MHDGLQDQPTFTLLSVAQVTHNYYFGAIYSQSCDANMQECIKAAWHPSLCNVCIKEGHTFGHK